MAARWRCTRRYPRAGGRDRIRRSVAGGAAECDPSPPMMESADVHNQSGRTSSCITSALRRSRLGISVRSANTETDTAQATWTPTACVSQSNGLLLTPGDQRPTSDDMWGSSTRAVRYVRVDEAAEVADIASAIPADHMAGGRENIMSCALEAVAHARKVLCRPSCANRT